MLYLNSRCQIREFLQQQRFVFDRVQKQNCSVACLLHRPIVACDTKREHRFLFVDATDAANFSGHAYFIVALDRLSIFADIPVSFSVGMTEGREDEAKMRLFRVWSHCKIK